MCGVTGFLRANGVTTPEDSKLLTDMSNLIAYRGPDDADVWAAGGVGLGHRRLSIIDLTAHGRQPMQRGPWMLAYNGEIYNYREIRDDLIAAGETFTTHTDTEVLLLALARWGEAALDRLNGMFAFALWNEETGELLLARDRVGKKPLYYAEINGDLIFASEVKSFLAWPGFQRRADLEAIHHYLSMQYVPAPWTAFEGVKCLPPGTLMRAKPGKVATPQRYWSLSAPGAAKSTNPEALKSELIELLDRSVHRRMLADVPVGAFLSGGVDSSAVVAFMAEHSAQPVKTFCIGFEDDAFDERRYARLVSDRFATDHHEEIVKPDATAILPELVWHYGDPFADPSAIPTYYVSRLTRRHVTVALTGDGGDEFFVGYGRYADCDRMGWIEHLPAPARALAGLGARSIPTALTRRRPFGGLRRRLSMASESNAKRYEPAMMYFYDVDKREGYGPALQPYLQDDTTDLLNPYFDACPDMVSGAAWADIHTYLPDDLLVKVDRASMAWSLEARAPFLDVDLMEFAAGIPRSIKMQGGLKGLLKSALRGRVPDNVLDRPKMGFGVPIELWFRNELHDFTLDILTAKSAVDRGLFKPGYAERLMRDHCNGVRHNHTKLWAMLILELWFQSWIDAKTVKKPPRPKLD